ncbi:CaiB/BaiF CoA-transferase family protein [Pigmentiphaga soli]|uniref:CaiB/BaiF CoA-transferase family protein n=1 Tax=Pigmentiphaga soli TaxID=1007095 RepID=A0ABP8GE16_9BURK
MADDGETRARSGPLAGLCIVEFAGIGPGPMAAMLLADLGADVLRIDRAEPVALGIRRPLRYNLLLRNRDAIALDLKRDDARALALRLVSGADALIEGFRPGVMERLGLGPDACLAANPKLVYGRMTGWGQDGPLARAAGHDLNYIALTGALGLIGRAGQPPAVPLNVIGDYGGGALYLALGMLAALLEAGRSGRGQVVDAAIVDGAASLMTSFFGMHAAGMLAPGRGANLLDSGAYFYDVYQCADGKWLSVAALEGKFHDELLRRLGIDAPPGAQEDRAQWPRMRSLLERTFRQRPRDQWCALLDGADACVAPVLSLDEAFAHPHLQARATFVDVDGVPQPAPAPRFSRSVPATPTPPRAATPESAHAALARWLGREEADMWTRRMA